MNIRTMSLRLPEPMARQLGAIARAEGVPIAEVLRVGIENHITARCSDEELRERLRKVQQEDREVLKDLGIEG